MRFVAIALLFCFAIVAFTVSARIFLRNSVETELEQQSLFVLKEAGFEGVIVDFDHLTGSISGYVDSPDELLAVTDLLESKVPGADWPSEEKADLTIRPTLLPWLRVTRAEESSVVTIEGILAGGDEAGRILLGSRLHLLDGI